MLRVAFLQMRTPAADGSVIGIDLPRNLSRAIGELYLELHIYRDRCTLQSLKIFAGCEIAPFRQIDTYFLLVELGRKGFVILQKLPQ